LCVEIDLTKSLHAAWRYLDNSLYTNEELNLMKAEDPFWAVNIDDCEALRNQISELWNPGQFMDVNEQTIPLKGRQKCRNYYPKKENKWHFKLWCLNDSETGYLMDFAQRTPVGSIFLIIECYQEHFLCAVLGTMSSRFCVPDTVCDVPDIIMNIVPNIIRHIFLIPDFGS
jgi:hypothetical protein